MGVDNLKKYLIVYYWSLKRLLQRRIFITFADMKNTIYIVLFIMLITVSCSGDGGVGGELAAIDSLADTRADSALCLLDAMKERMAGEDTPAQMYYSLVRIKAADKAGLRPASDSVIQRVVSYYENDGEQRLLPVAYYYAGRAYRRMNDAPRALGYMQKAAEAADGQGVKGRLRSKIYSQTGYLMSLQGFAAEALECHEKAYAASRAVGDTLGMVFSLRDIGEESWSLNRGDSALSYYSRAAELALACGEMEAYANVNRQMAVIWLIKGDTENAGRALRCSEVYVDSADISSTLSIYADYYAQAGMADSALVCDRRLVSEGNVYGRRAAYGRMTEYYLERGDVSAARRCFAMYRAYGDSVAAVTAADEMADAYAMYDYKLREKENMELIVKRNNDQVKLVVLGSLCIVLALATAFLVVRNRLRAQLRRFKKERLRHIEAEAAGTGGHDGRFEQLVATGAYMNVQKRISEYPVKQVSLTDIEWRELDEEVNRVYCGFGRKVRELCSMSRHEYRVCLLVKIGVAPVNIAQMTNHSKEAITSVRRRLFFKAFGEKASPAEWDKIIRSL